MGGHGLVGDRRVVSQSNFVGDRRIMRQPSLSDETWAAVRPLLPPAPARPEGGRPRVPDRAALTGILFVLRNRIAWESLPRELGCGSGMTCWRRLREWQRAGVWPRVRRVLIERLPEADRIDWVRSSHTGGTSARPRSGLPVPTGFPGPTGPRQRQRAGLPGARGTAGARPGQSAASGADLGHRNAS
jgi:transposase